MPYKMDYPDHGKWMRRNEKFRKFVKDFLLDERTWIGSLIQTCKKVREHMSYEKDNMMQFGALIFKLWDRLFIDEN